MENETIETTEAIVKKGWNEIHFALIYMVFALAGVCAATYYDISPLNIMSSSANGVTIWLISMIGLMTFLNGLKCNVVNEIVTKQNKALAILVGLFGVGVAIVIHG
jgi:hypothetical protein